MGLALHLCHLLGLALSPGRVGKESCLFCEGETVMDLEGGGWIDRDKRYRGKVPGPVGL